ncbi:DUF2652 domain-containing protein [Foetidibacter luteolus]|uniref:DUF2652 domain-containing protein n=1 Tax=Foetidibacter luteolus TaxID=2608880 RepID=UPI00129B8386|nr:DUF2652 domain-containing protein [Foetidibacter luteolus]
MPETNATILIPDISGFTEFMTSTELSHASLAINMLIEAILKAVGDEYHVSEIEGDAVLLIKKGAAPSQQEILDTCLAIFNAFHFQRSWMQDYTVCPCGACQALVKLSLKFVAHHGPLAEIKVGGFVKQSGKEMIVAHRLLKNSINNDEYLLVTEQLLQNVTGATALPETGWATASEEYASIGKVDYRFMLLNEKRKQAPLPPKPATDYYTDDTPYLELDIAADFFTVYMTVMNIPGRAAWAPGLQKVEQDMPAVVIGSIHHCQFDDYHTVVSPLRMLMTDDSITFAESCHIKELNLHLVHEFICKKLDENTCRLVCRCMNAGNETLSPGTQAMLWDKLNQMALQLKDYCEKPATVA